MKKLIEQISALTFFFSFAYTFPNLYAQTLPQFRDIYAFHVKKYENRSESSSLTVATQSEHTYSRCLVTSNKVQVDQKVALLVDSNTLGAAPSSAVRCGAFIEVGVWKDFKCHNLGSDEQVDPFTPGLKLIGNYYQWGQSVVSAAGPDCSRENGETITIWNRKSYSNGSWTDEYKTENDPCPTGFRVPTKSEWEAVINPLLNPTLKFLGTWASHSTNYSAGLLIGSDISGLFLPAAGARDFIDGTLFDRGYRGDYWSSTDSGNYYAWSLRFYQGNALTYINYRTFGFSVRCIAQ